MRRLRWGWLAALALAACAATPPPIQDWRPLHVAGEAARELIRLGEAPLSDAWTAARLTAETLDLSPDGSGADLAPGVTFAGGLRLIREEPRIGGLSDLEVAADGRFLAIGDEGLWLRGRLVQDAGGLRGIDGVEIRLLNDPSGAPLLRKFDADAEGLARMPDGRAAVSFERDHRIWLYDPESGRVAGRLAAPAQALTENDGLEGIAAAGPDAVWAAGEGGGLWRCDARRCDPRWPVPRRRLTDTELRITSLTPDPRHPGRLYAVQRAFDPGIGNTIRILRFDPARPPRSVQVLATLRRPAAVDNYEGIAALVLDDGRTRLILLSDDNFNPRQRTLMLAFDVAP